MMTPLEINHLGYQVLTEALGFDGMVRFLRQFEFGSGDYSKDRHQWLDDFTVEDIFNQVQHQRENSGQSINLSIADAS